MRKFISKMYNKYKQFIQFCVVGVINTAVTFAVYSLLTGLLNVSPPIADIPSNIAGGINSYIWNSKWVFKNNAASSIPKFIVTFLIYLAASFALIWLFTDVLSINKYVAKIIVIPITMILNFLISKFWAFK